MSDATIGLSPDEPPPDPAPSVTLMMLPWGVFTNSFESAQLMEHSLTSRSPAVGTAPLEYERFGLILLGMD
jgi:hypothetical protein